MNDLSKMIIWQPKKTFKFKLYHLLWYLPFGNKWKDHWNTKMCNHINKQLLDVLKNNKSQKLVKPFKDCELEWEYEWEVITDGFTKALKKVNETILEARERNKYISEMRVPTLFQEYIKTLDSYNNEFNYCYLDNGVRVVIDSIMDIYNMVTVIYDTGEVEYLKIRM